MSPRRALWAGMFEGGWLGLGAYATELLTSAPPERRSEASERSRVSMSRVLMSRVCTLTTKLMRVGSELTQTRPLA